jgi:methylthioribose-1-phosphate isomerase
MPEVILFKDNKLFILDQRKLPESEEYLELSNPDDAGNAIKNMAVRGAPAIGIAGAYGYCLGCLEKKLDSLENIKNYMSEVKEKLLATRPTAVNLKWALDKMEERLSQLEDLQPEAVCRELIRAAHQIKDSEIQANKQIGKYGADMLEDLGRKKRKITVLTHCNAGALATGGWGTALGVIRSAFNKGVIERVYADETRPRLQGARLTCYELKEENIPYTLICDNMSGLLMMLNKIDTVVVGADRIAANGDVANKIGTYMVAVLAHRHEIPFYVAAPESTFDFGTPSGEEIQIEQRPEEEVLNIYDQCIAPQGTQAENPAFDITPRELVTAYITQKGVIKDPMKP